MKSYQTQFRARRRGSVRRGSIMVLTAVTLIAVFAFVAFAIDIGLITKTHADLQHTADAAALASARFVQDDFDTAAQKAIDIAGQNMPSGGEVLAYNDVSLGVWDADSRSFTETSDSPNAVRIVTRRSSVNGNALPLLFASMIGNDQMSLHATSIAMLPITNSNDPVFRFLVDEELIDSDVHSIEQLSQQHGVSSDWFVWDNDGDGWLDFPAGVQLEVPTGQQGDEGLFDWRQYEDDFPFTPTSQYTQFEFLCEGTALQQIHNTRELQDIEWNGSNAPHHELNGKKILDPVLGVNPMSEHWEILNLPDPDAVYVSPVFKSDVSMVETDLSKYGAPAASLLGERRGLMCYKIISARNNPAGGSYLPLITIEIVDPSGVDLANTPFATSSNGGGSTVGKAKLVF